MRVRGRVTGRPARILTVVAALALIAACGDDDTADGTLDVIGGTGSGVATASAPVPGSGGVPGTTVAAGDAGSGFVSITVEVAVDGIAETVSLDRASVAAASLDPVSLDALCTPLDAGVDAAPVEVAVVDLRRLAGERLVSAVLRYGDAGPGAHDMTLELGGADQVTTQYTGTVTVDDTGLAGTFEGTNAEGAGATGSFVCAPEAVVTTTTVPPPPPTEAPESSAEPTTTTTTTPGSTTSTVP